MTLPDDDLVPTALHAADIDRVDGVSGPASGVPFLVIKAADAGTVVDVVRRPAVASVAPVVAPRAPGRLWGVAPSVPGVLSGLTTTRPTVPTTDAGLLGTRR
jgi:hypothetical protein